MDVPIVAWQQAVIVVLFAVVFFAFLRYLTSWFGKQQQEWQEFIRRRDAEWFSWLEKSDRASCNAMDKITDALDGLIAEVKNNNNLLIKHDSKVHERVEAAARRRKPTTGPLNGEGKP